MKNAKQNHSYSKSATTRSGRAHKIAASIAALLLFSASATAQINSSVPFHGQYRADFEGGATISNGYVPNPLFLGRADYHSTASYKGSIAYNPAGCTVNANSGSGYVVHIGPDAAWFDFDMSPARFGGYFNGFLLNGSATVNVRFIGYGNVLLGTDTLFLQNNCAWQWIGWEFIATDVYRIEIEAPGSSYLLMDDLNMDLPINSGCAVTYCTGDGTDGECPCSNYGDPGHGCSTGTNQRGGRLTESITNGCSFVQGSLNGLVAKDVTPNELGVFIEGKGPNNLGQGAIFGDGRLCVGGAASKLQFVVANSQGVAATTVDLPSASAAQGSYIGDEVYYQFLYRTPGAHSACGGTWNLTNGVHWTWTF